MNSEGLDGEDHINIYSKGKTEIGRWLSNFSHTEIITEDGKFSSIEGYWYWLTTKDERLRTLIGWAAKDLGKRCEKIKSYEDEEFKLKVCKKKLHLIKYLNLKIYYKAY